VQHALLESLISGRARLAQLSFYYSPAVSWNDRLKTMCPSSAPIVMQAYVSESTEVQCALNTVSMELKADPTEARSIPVGSTLIIEGLNAHMCVSLAAVPS